MPVELPDAALVVALRAGVVAVVMTVTKPGEYAPNPRRPYLCPYCNHYAVLRDEGVVIDRYKNVCHESCLDRERRFAESHRV